MNAYIAISAMVMFIVFFTLLANIIHYGLVCINGRNSRVLHQSVKATKKLKTIAFKIDATLIGTIILLGHQWLIMNVISL